MKKGTNLALVAVLLIVFVALGHMFSPLPKTSAQSGASPVQQIASRADSAAICVSSNTSAGTITFTPPGGQSVYLTEIDFENGQSTTGVAAAAAPTTVTVSNITGSPTWNIASGPATTPGTTTQSFSVVYPTGLKSTTPGTPVVFTLPAIITNQFLRVNACAWFGQ